MGSIRIATIVTQPGQGGIEVVSKLNYDSDIVYLNSSGQQGFRSTQYGILTRILTVASVLRKYDVVVTNLPIHHMLVSLLGYIFSFKHICVEHGPWVHAISLKSPIYISFVYQYWLSKSKCKFICVSKDLLALYNLLRTNNVYIPNCISPEVREGVGKKLYRDQTVRLVFVGRFDLQKNASLAISVVDNLRNSGVNATLDMYGDGSLLDSLKEKHGYKDHLTFLGYQKNVRERLECYDILLLTSLFEGLPGVALEALKSGLKVVASPFMTGLLELNSFPEVFIANGCDSNSLVNALNMAIDCNLESSGTISKVTDIYDPLTVSRQYNNVIYKVGDL
jgi:glycosyltransferase involved in cell wall biosynthesis